jgi:hypothetical protein
MSDFDRIKVMDRKYKMRQVLKLLLISFCLIIWGKSFAENTSILEDVTPSPSTFESDYTNEPEVTITKEAESKIEEYRLNGHLYMIKITPDDSPPYYLYKETLGGAWITFHGVEEPLIVPQWVAYEF